MATTAACGCPCGLALGQPSAPLPQRTATSNLGSSALFRSARLQSNLSFAPKRNVAMRLGARAETLYVGAEEAKNLVEEGGFAVLDVRDSTQFEKSHIQGSIHIPSFIVNEDSDFGTAIKRQAHYNFVGFLFGLAFTKPNPGFLAQVQSRFPDKAARLLVVCQEGLRSSSAVDQLEDLGYTNLALLDTGLNKVPPGTFPKEGPRELKDAGKGGFVAIQTQFSVILATILISLILFLQFFPDASLQILGSS